MSLRQACGGLQFPRVAGEKNAASARLPKGHGTGCIATCFGSVVAPLTISAGSYFPVAAISHQTALRLFELGDFNPAKVHMTVPPIFRRNSRPPKAVVLHRATLAPAELTQLRGLTVCRPLRALCDVASADPNAIEDLRQAAVEARRRGLITEREISAMKQKESTRKLVTTLLP